MKMERKTLIQAFAKFFTGVVLVGALLFPTGAFFPGFTLTAACTGLLYGLCLYRRDRSLL